MSVNQTEDISHSVLRADLVLAGGGIRGIAHVGALAYAEQLGYVWQNIAGTSAGSIIGALTAAGYTAAEMQDIMTNVDYSKFADSLGFDPFHAQDVYDILMRGGIHSGNYLEQFMHDLLAAKGIQKFGDLITDPAENDPRYRYKLMIIASDITREQQLQFPQDAAVYGLNPDDLDIARAVRMSASVPFFFLPVEQQHSDGTMSRIVDGGILSNFPVSVFDTPADQQPAWPTFGLKFVDPTTTTTVNNSWLFPSGNALETIQALIGTMLSAHDKLFMDDQTYVRSIPISTGGISSLNFNLTKQQAAQLYTNGFQAAQTFFKTWDFDAYRITYRSGLAIPTRQERLHTEMKQTATQTVV